MRIRAIQQPEFIIEGLSLDYTEALYTVLGGRNNRGIDMLGDLYKVLRQALLEAGRLPNGISSEKYYLEVDHQFNSWCIKNK